MKINIVCVGKIKESFYNEAIEEYRKRLGRFCDFKIFEVSESCNPQIPQALKEEGLSIKKHLKGDLMIMDIEGDLVTSKQLSCMIADIKNLGCGEITFVIGSSNGLCSEIKNDGRKISFGRVTFPHQLMRVILSEQIYRAFAIINNTPYHK